MDDTILLVFEGARTEPQIFDNLKRTVFDSTNSIIQATFGTHIYQLWNCIKGDPDLDLLEVIKEQNARNQTNIQDLEGIERDDVSQIFLFFDYDGHVDKASDEELQQMLKHFDEETENGKLYISYPMVEALKHLTPDFKTHTVPAKDKIGYKKIVGDFRSPYQDLRNINPEGWKHIISENMKKGNYIANDEHVLPEAFILQPTIFEGQLTKYIRPAKHVAVLSGIPFFLIEYFGLETILEDE